MDLSVHIQEHMEVVGSDGKHVGTVDHLEGDQLKLTSPRQPAASTTISASTRSTTWSKARCASTFPPNRR